MALVSLVAKIRLEGAQAAEQGFRRVRHAAESAADGIRHAGASVNRLGSALQSLGGVAENVAGKLGAVTAAVGIGGVGLGFAAFNVASKLDSLTRGLSTVSSSSADLSRQLRQLEQVAKLPGLSFEQAVQGSLALQSAGLSASLSVRALTSFGNALASVGKGSAELEGVVTALSQIISKGSVSAEEINQIAERVPQIRRLLSDAFGTADTEQIQALGLSAETAIERIVAAAEKLPKVSGGIGNLLENVSDRLQRAIAPLGRGLASLFEAALPTIERFASVVQERLTQVGEVFSAIARSGVFAEVLDRLTSGLGGFLKFGTGDIIDFAARILSAIANIGTAATALGNYLSELFGQIAHNTQEAFKVAISYVRVFAESARNVLAFLDPIHFKPTKLSDFYDGDFKAITAQLPDFGKILNQDTDRFGRAIRDGYRPDSQIPEGLTYQQRVAQATKSGQDDARTAVEDYLARIEKNTKSAADELSLRRQTLGGGEVARLGVTSTELRRAGGTGLTPPDGDYGVRRENTELERSIRNLIRQEMSKQTGAGRIRG